MTVRPGNLTEKRIEELEEKRVSLTQRLMEAQTVTEANDNDIEHELWAVRAAILHYRSRLKKKPLPADANSRNEN